VHSLQPAAEQAGIVEDAVSIANPIIGTVQEAKVDAVQVLQLPKQEAVAADVAVTTPAVMVCWTYPSAILTQLEAALYTMHPAMTAVGVIATQSVDAALPATDVVRGAALVPAQGI
jgi:hypothetical protein